jgi:cytochrome c
VTLHKHLLLPVLLAVAVPAATAAPSGDKSGDAQRGAAIYERCQACHSLERNRTGPKHCGLLGRRAGSVADFHGYSAALRDSGIVWSRESLDRFLADPRGTVPGTRMGYAGVKDDQERADLIAFLAAAGACKD